MGLKELVLMCFKAVRLRLGHNDAVNAAGGNTHVIRRDSQASFSRQIVAHAGDCREAQV